MTKEIQLSKGMVALVDDEDFELLSKYHWNTLEDKKNKYATSNSKGRMHRFIMRAKPGQIIDHIDRNGLNNQKANLRFCDHIQNAQNKIKLSPNKKYKGIYWFENCKRWRAKIMINHISIHLGMFSTPEEAAIAYNNAAIKYFGEFACINIIE